MARSVTEPLSMSDLEICIAALKSLALISETYATGRPDLIEEVAKMLASREEAWGLLGQIRLQLAEFIKPGVIIQVRRLQHGDRGTAET